MDKHSHSREAMDALFRDIDEAVGAPETESDEERDHRHEVMNADSERRKQRKLA